jgi:hypothetical protein
MLNLAWAGMHPLFKFKLATRRFFCLGWCRSSEIGVS